MKGFPCRRDQQRQISLYGMTARKSVIHPWGSGSTAALSHGRTGCLRSSSVTTVPKIVSEGTSPSLLVSDLKLVARELAHLQPAR